EMIRRGVAFVARETVLRIDGVPLFHAGVAVRFREDGSCGDGNAARVALDQRLLLNEHVELHGINEEIVGRDGETLERGGHSLARSLINVPGIDALRIHFRNGPSHRVFANALAEFGAALRSEVLRIVETDNTALGIENHRGGNHRAKQSAASGFIDAGDARPTQFARRSLETGRAEPAHRVGILARCGQAVASSFLDEATCCVTRYSACTPKNMCSCKIGGESHATSPETSFTALKTHLLCDVVFFHAPICWC